MDREAGLGTGWPRRRRVTRVHVVVVLEVRVSAGGVVIEMGERRAEVNGGAAVGGWKREEAIGTGKTVMG